MSLVAARAAFARPFRPATSAARGRQWRQFVLGPVFGLLVVTCALIESRWHPAVLSYSAGTPWPEALVRLPLSVIAPAQYLPWWGAVLQTTIVVALVQPALGAKRLLVVALSAHVLATVAMRVLVHLAATDVPYHWAHELDSGPSVAVLAAGAAAAATTGGWPVAGVLATGVTLELVVLQAQAGVEHAVGVSIGLACGALWHHRRHRPALIPRAPVRPTAATEPAAHPAPPLPRIAAAVALRRGDGLRT